jgi:hypothetical protein
MEDQSIDVQIPNEYASRVLCLNQGTVILKCKRSVLHNRRLLSEIVSDIGKDVEALIEGLFNSRTFVIMCGKIALITGIKLQGGLPEKAIIDAATILMSIIAMSIEECGAMDEIPRFTARLNASTPEELNIYIRSVII